MEGSKIFKTTAKLIDKRPGLTPGCIFIARVPNEHLPE
ncbi:hypothetical protein DCCM_0907 [Desulfocucumis palustris]|uniref:Uncharacterized protein n=1 Tax=Desulfocucumis palustris TaxID=1898651 RepID=A0A2L2XFS2_9FIRM|nr:hypothetical protein DCCM_0907 [Desulfocucumis palustris]